jgi:hypothetical protein
MLKETDGTSTLTTIPDTDVLLGSIMRDIEWQAPPNAASIQKVKVSDTMLSKAKEQLSNGSKLLEKEGYDEISARIIIDGLSGNANYYSVIVTVFEGKHEGIYNVMLIDSFNGLYRMIPVADGDEDAVIFDSLDIVQADTDLSDLIRDSFPQESEGFA